MPVSTRPAPERPLLSRRKRGAQSPRRRRCRPTVIIFDLEDSVSPANKERAREAVAQAVAEMATGRREIIVRLNGLDTPWIARDIAAMVTAKPDALLLPKIARTDDIRRARAAIGATSRRKA